MEEAKPSSETSNETSVNQESAAAEETLVGIERFMELELRVAQIMAAERIEKSKKLVKLRVNVGEEAGGERQIVAGIAQHYQPDELVGRKIVILANLRPAKLMGEESRGMLLAASDEQGNLSLLDPGSMMPPGAGVR